MRNGEAGRRVTNCNEDRFRSGDGDPVRYVIDSTSSWNAASASGDGRATTFPTGLIRVRWMHFFDSRFP